MISPEQMRKLHAVAKQAGEGHDHIRDRAATLWDIGSLKDLDSVQASHLIDVYQAEIEPPKSPAPAPIPRFNFGSLPKRVEKKAAAAASRPVPAAASIHPALVMPPVGRPVPSPATNKPSRPRRPNIAIDPELEKIPW
jgi:hypothetical protein